jgi:hypothetical protein
MENHAVNLLEQQINTLFKNRHGVGWGYLRSGRMKEYRGCQRERRKELWELIHGLRILKNNRG